MRPQGTVPKRMLEGIKGTAGAHFGRHETSSKKTVTGAHATSNDRKAGLLMKRRQGGDTDVCGKKWCEVLVRGRIGKEFPGDKARCEGSDGRKIDLARNPPVVCTCIVPFDPLGAGIPDPTF